MINTRRITEAPDLEGAVEALEQPVADLSEMRHLLPAGPQSAGPRQPVALTLRSHIVPHRLQFHTQIDGRDKRRRYREGIYPPPTPPTRHTLQPYWSLYRLTVENVPEPSPRGN